MTHHLSNVVLFFIAAALAALLLLFGKLSDIALADTVAFLLISVFGLLINAIRIFAPARLSQPTSSEVSK